MTNEPTTQEPKKKEPKTLPSNWMLLAYLTVAEFALLVRASEKSVCRWVKNDPTLPVLRIGGSLRFPKDRLLAWLKSREQGAGRARQMRELMHSTTQPVDGKKETQEGKAVCA